MTTAARVRCNHCQSSYIYHPSFYGGDEINYPYNHDKYCQECYKVVKEALAKIPVKYERRFLLSSTYTKQDIVSHQEKRLAEGVPVRRIFPNLFDVTGKTRHMIVCESMPDGEWYKAEWWSHEPDKVMVTKETWCKIENPPIKVDYNVVF